MGPKMVTRTLTTDTKTTDAEGLGTLRFETDGTQYRWVQNTATNVTFNTGDVVVHNFTDGQNAILYANQAATATLGFMAGVICATNGLQPNTGTGAYCYGWIQVLGRAKANVTPANTQTTNSPIAGTQIIAVNGQQYGAAGSAMGTAPTYQRNLMCLDVVTPGTASTSVNVMVLCLE